MQSNKALHLTMAANIRKLKLENELDWKSISKQNSSSRSSIDSNKCRLDIITFQASKMKIRYWHYNKSIERFLRFLRIMICKTFWSFMFLVFEIRVEKKINHLENLVTKVHSDQMPVDITKALNQPEIYIKRKTYMFSKIYYSHWVITLITFKFLVLTNNVPHCKAIFVFLFFIQANSYVWTNGPVLNKYWSSD